MSFRARNPGWLGLLEVAKKKRGISTRGKGGRDAAACLVSEGHAAWRIRAAPTDYLAGAPGVSGLARRGD